MERAGTVIRRSGAKLRTSLGAASHADLQMAITQLRDAKATHRAFAHSEAAAWQDLTKWGLRGSGDDDEDSRAIRDALAQMGELSAVWADAQRQTNEALRELRRQLEVVLEGERGVDAARSALSDSEGRCDRARKELKKAPKRRATRQELAEMTDRLEAAERERDVVQMELTDRQREHRVAKAVRIREGLLRMTQAYVDAAQKCEILFAAANFVAKQMPDLVSHDMETSSSRVKYTGSGAARRAVQTAKDRVKHFRRLERTGFGAPQSSSSSLCDPLDPPPPYSEAPSTMNATTSECSSGGHSSAVADPRRSATQEASSTNCPVEAPLPDCGLRSNMSLPLSLEAAAASSSSSRSSLTAAHLHWRPTQDDNFSNISTFLDKHLRQLDLRD